QCRDAAVAVSLVRAAIPEHDRSAAVLAGRNRSLERVVLHRVVFDLAGESPLRGVARCSFVDRPALHYPVELEAEIVVEMAGGVLLNYELERPNATRGCRSVHSAALGFASPREISLCAVLAQRAATPRCAR